MSSRAPFFCLSNPDIQLKTSENPAKAKAEPEGWSPKIYDGWQGRQRRCECHAGCQGRCRTSGPLQGVRDVAAPPEDILRKNERGGPAFLETCASKAASVIV